MTSPFSTNQDGLSVARTPTIGRLPPLSQHIGTNQHDGGPGRSVTTGRIRRDTYHQVKVQLHKLIAQLAADGQLRLPAEEKLSAQLEVSRATVRSALLSLQKEGRIQRVHGRGTFINRHALKIQANITQDRPFAELLDELGHTAVVRNVDIHVEPLTPAMLEPLELSTVEDACVIERIFEASGEPAVLCIDFVPMSRLHAAADSLEGQESVFEFIRRYTGRRVRYSVADIVPVMPTAGIASALRVAADQPLVLLRHTHIDEDDQPVAFTRAYINDRFLRFSVVRTYTGS